MPMVGSGIGGLGDGCVWGRGKGEGSPGGRSGARDGDMGGGGRRVQCDGSPAASIPSPLSGFVYASVA